MRFEDMHEGWDKNMKKMEKRLNGYETLMEEIKYLAEKWRAETKDGQRDLVKNIFDR